MIAAVTPSQANRRLAAGLIFSAFLHAAFSLGIGSAPPQGGGPGALTVELLQTAPSSTAAKRGIDTTAGHTPAASATRSHGHKVPAEIALAYDRYYTASELDQRAQQVNEVALVYPKAAYEMRIRGRVVVNILISDTGEIDALSVLESEPAGVFDGHALAAAEALEFVPAIKDGQPVRSRKKIEIVYDPYQSINVP
jgi:TonB family protein